VTLRSRFWLITMASVLAFLATLSLGRWQLSRAAQKESLQAAIDSKARQPSLDNRSLAALADDSGAPGLATALHRTVNLRGTWVAERTIFLDNRQMNAKPGLYVLTPLRLEGSGRAVLVQRGWVARNFIDRTSVPAIAVPAGLVEIQGRIAPPPSKLYALGAPEQGLIRQNLDLAQFRGESGLALLDVTVQQTGAASEGLLREWPVVSSGSAKNYGYAFQWFGLCALIAILYVWFQIGKRFFSRQRT
jgi:surfeit locus 1 family protein